jgi:glycosyltransferase involved in cell wall biosynthesis
VAGMRVLVVTPEFPPHTGGGILKYYDLLVPHLVRAGADVTVLVATPFSAFDDYVTPDGVSVRFVPLPEVERHAGRLAHLEAASVYRRYVAAGLAAADIVSSLADRLDLVATTDFGLLFAPLLTLDSRPPVVVSMHGSLGQIAEHEPIEPKASLDCSLAQLTEAILLPSADSLVAYSPANAEEWRMRLGRQVALLPVPLDLPQPHDGDAAGFPGLVAARVQAWKGPQVLCEALALLEDRRPADLRIAWVGRDTSTASGGASMQQWLAHAYPGVWGSQVVPLGQRPHADTRRLQASARYIVVPSMWDTFNYTVAESMAAGSVTIASSGAGASYLIDHGVNGYRFDPLDPAQLAERLLEAHGLDAGARRRIGDAARETVVARLDPQAAAEATLEHFAEVSRRRMTAVRPVPWVRGFIEGTNDAIGEDAFLENVGIRTLGRHLGRRLLRRLSLQRA